MDRRARSPRLLAALFHVAYIYAHRIKNLHYLLIEVNPRHVGYYETMLGFKVIGAERHNARVNAPAVLLALDLQHAEEQIRLFGGKPEMAATERSAYPHFFSPKDEAGIVDRLRQTDEDIAHVTEAVRGPPLPQTADRRAPLASNTCMQPWEALRRQDCPGAARRRSAAKRCARSWQCNAPQPLSGCCGAARAA